MKYIPAEKLIAKIESEIESSSKRINPGKNDEISTHYRGEVTALFTIKSFIISLQQEQSKSKLVKVRCVFPFDETWEKNKIYTCKVWYHGDLNRNFWDVYYDYEKDPKYVQFPTIELLNEEFAIIQEESQVISEQSEVELDREIIKYKVPFTDEKEYLNETTLDAIARHFTEWGAIHLNAKQKQPEVNLEKEVQRWKNEHGIVGMDDLWLNFAHYFYELSRNTK